jgi:hypothetical protein
MRGVVVYSRHKNENSFIDFSFSLFMRLRFIRFSFACDVVCHGKILLESSLFEKYLSLCTFKFKLTVIYLNAKLPQPSRGL